MKLFPKTTNVFLLGNDTKYLDKIYAGEIDYSNGLKFKEIPE